MKEKIYKEALNMLAKCYELKLYNLSFTDILEQMYKTTKSPMRAGIINELINEEINR
jgi:hypothetical protein